MVRIGLSGDGSAFKGFLASSDLKDIAQYCKTHSIEYLTTIDFLCEAKEGADE